MGQRTLAVFALHYPFIFILFRKIPWFRGWIEGGHTALYAVLVSFMIVVVASLPVFDTALRGIMRIPYLFTGRSKK